MRSYWSRTGPKSSAWCPYNKAMLETEENGDGGRDWNDASTSPGRQGLPRPPDTGREAQGASASEPPEGTSPTYLLRLLASRAVNKIVCCFKPLSLWCFGYDGPREPMKSQQKGQESGTAFMQPEPEKEASFPLPCWAFAQDSVSGDHTWTVRCRAA